MKITLKKIFTNIFTNSNLNTINIPDTLCNSELTETPSTKTIFVGPNDPTFAGIHSATSHIQKVFNFPFVNLEHVLAHPQNFDNYNIILEGWIPPYHDLIKCTNARHFVRYQSPITQMELSGVELDQLLFLKAAKESKLIDALFVTSESLFRAVNPVAEWWPNAVSVKSLNFTPQNKVGNLAGLFMTYTPRKNLATNLFSCRLMGCDVISNDNLPALFQQLCSEFDIQISYSPRLNDSEYYGLLSTLDFTLQVTLSESLNYGVVDSLLSGTPSLIGPNTPLAKISNSYDNLCTIDRVDNPIDIANKGRILLENKSARDDALGYGLELLSQYSDHATDVGNSVIERWNF